MEAILAKLLVANSKTVQEGTKELKEAFKNPEAILALCDVIVTSQNSQIRQSAAVLLRRKLGKKRQWNKLSVDIRNRIKQGMIQALVNEQEKLVKNAIAQFIGILGKFEFPENTWPEVLQFIHTLCSSETVFDKELGMYTLSIMTEMSQSSYINHAESFAVLFTDTLNQMQDLHTNLAYYTIITMKNLVAVIGGHQQMINVYHSLLPRVLQIINAFALADDEKRACDLFEILEELIEFAVSVVVPYVRPIVEMCLQIANNKSLPASVQVKAVSVVSWLIRSKGKVIQKNKLIEPIIDVLIQLMAQKADEDGEEEYFLGESDQYSTITIATQTLDLVALHTPADKVVPYLLTKVEPAIQSGDIYAQKAAYLSLAVLAEGCAEQIRRKYLEPLLRCVCAAIDNPQPVVRNAALFALGQFAEHLQPEISQYASELLPVLFECLNKIFQQMEAEKKDPPSLDRLFYALESFCENLDGELIPYLPVLMERLFTALDPNFSKFSLQLKRVALSTLGSTVSAVKDGILPYFHKIIGILNVYINADPQSNLFELQCYAIEALALVAQFIGPEHFKPLAEGTIQFSMKLLKETEDPDVKKSLYALFAALSIVIKEEFKPILSEVVSSMLESIQSSEGIVTHYEEEEKDDLDVYGELSDDEDVEEDIESTSSEDSAACRYSVENAYNEEKEQACLALREICINTGTAFLPYIESTFEEIFALVNYPQEDIRKASVEALLQFCIALYKVNTPESKNALYKALQMFVPKCAELIRVDEERSVVMVCLEAYATLLEEIKGEVLVGEGHREAIMNCVIDVLTYKTLCQDNDEQHTENDEDTEAEQDELLLETAGEVIPKFGLAITPDDFACYFPNIFTLMGNRSKKQNSIASRSFAFGTLAECMKPLGIYVEKFVSLLMELWLTGAKDSAEEVRNNAIFGLGEMVLHGKEKIFSFYTDILQSLSAAVAKETHAGTLDNICGALAKMILVNPSGIPLEQVFPAFIQRLPLREDFEENQAVINCLFGLYQQGNQIIKQHLTDVIKILAHIYYKDQIPDDETRATLVEFLKIINRDFAADFANCVSSLGPEVTESLQKLFAS